MKSCPNPSSLVANPSSTIIKFTMNGQDTSAASLTSFPSAGFTAASGNTVLSWTIETRSLDGVTQIGLTDSPNVRGPIRYRLFDGFDTLTEVIGNNVGDILNVMAENIERIVITTDTPTNDGKPPRNVKLVLSGCFKGDGLATKAQVENADTTTVQGKYKNPPMHSVTHYFVSIVSKLTTTASSK